MRAVLPGKPRATLQAVSTARWNEKRLVVYVSGNAIVILDGPEHLVQTIYQDDGVGLDTVAIDEATGKIATCSNNCVYIYRPYGQDDGVLKWSLQLSFEVTAKGDTIKTLSWGSSGEILVGSRALRLFDTENEGKLVWERILSSPVVRATFSGDATLVASHAQHDRLVKIWRRLTFGADEVQFDFSYLSHPSTVTGLYWRKSNDREREVQHVLYTICTDKKIRIWSATSPHGLQVLQLWNIIDMEGSIQPRYLEPQSKPASRFAFFMASQEFKTTILGALELAMAPAEKPILEHLLEIAARSPDICVVMDDKGHMCAWGLRNVGGKDQLPEDIFNIALVENFNIFLLQDVSKDDAFVTIVNFRCEQQTSEYCLLVHRCGGDIAWLQGRVDEFFDPSPRQSRLHPKALWTGHEGSINKIVRTRGGRAVFSRTNDNEGLLWKQSHQGEDAILVQNSALASDEHIHRTCVLAGGRFVANLHHRAISLWDTSGQAAVKIAARPFDISGKALCLLQLPNPEKTSSSRWLATITSDMKGLVWEICIPPLEDRSEDGPIPSNPPIAEFCKFELGSVNDLAFVIPIDPAGTAPVVSGFLDTFAKDIALSYTSAGVLCTWTAKINANARTVDWLATATIVTGINNPSLASGSSIRKIAIVNDSCDDLAIWDTVNNQLEYEKQFGPGDNVQDLDWTSTPDDQSILAVGFPHKVMILAQIRYDYLDKGPAWAPIREICIRELTPHPIGDSTWLGNGNLIIGAGNQLFMYDKVVSASDEMLKEFSMPTHRYASPDLFDVVSLLNGPLPIFHPQLLSQCVLTGKLTLVQKVLINLHKELKFYSNGDLLDSSLSMDLDGIYKEQTAKYASAKDTRRSSLIRGDDEEDDTVTEEVATILIENLAQKSLPYLSSREQVHLADLVECVATAEKHRRSMDDNAMRYLLFFRQHMLRKTQSPGLSGGVSWREFAWAYHSGSQDILVDLVSRQFSGRMLWEHARDSGMFIWITDITALRAQFEVIARNEYTKTDEKNPVDCSLYYLALKKKNVLIGLWRMATWHRERIGTQKLLANNFADPRWKTAALKNAYALLGKRRFEYAAAFFLLAGHLRDAVNICANQMQDLQLAVAVARVYEGDDGAVLHELLEERVLPKAATEGNRWMATWAFWMLGRRDVAVRALVTPVYQLLDRPTTPNQEGKSYLATDPALVVLYKQLREKTLQTIKGATEITPRAEWEFVVQIARLYDRMGCDLLALDLVRNWEFLKQLPTPQKAANKEAPDLRLLLRRRSSLVVADLPTIAPTTTKTPGGLRSPSLKEFQEPEADSLLDAFGF